MSDIYYPPYVVTTDGEYIGTFLRVDPGGFPIYRFPGGDRMVDSAELRTGKPSRGQAENYANFLREKRKKEHPGNV